MRKYSSFMDFSNTPPVTKTVVSKALSTFLSTFHDKSERHRENSQCEIYKYVPLGFNHRELEQIDIQFAFVLGRTWSHLSCIHYRGVRKKKKIGEAKSMGGHNLPLLVEMGLICLKI
jgi:hypothetical protein